METISVLLKIAKKDLEASKILFNNKLHAQATFYLQQCLEKAIKSWGIKSGIITEAELWKEIGHDALKIFLKSFDQFRNQVYLEVRGKKIPLNKVEIEKTYARAIKAS